MKKASLKIFFIGTFVLIGVFSLFFISNNAKVLAQVEKDTIVVETTGYSILSASSFVFGGYYSGNFDKKGFTTYFEFKEDNSNLEVDSGDLLEYFNLLDKDKQETIIIKREKDVEGYGYFYTSPELQLFSDYFFRAVGYFNDIPDKKYYGDVLHLRTGYIPYGGTPPFTVIITLTKDYKAIEYNIPDVCDFLGSLLYKVCDTKISPPTPKPLAPKPVTPKPITPTTTTPPKDFSGGLVPCDNSVEHPCDFNQFLKLINTVIDFIFTNLVLPIAAIMFAYAGFELVTSGGSTEKKSKAKSIFTNVAIGLIIAVAAFLIIKTILSIVGYTGTTFLK